MNFRWLKRYVPRGLYSRAALILILPVVTLQLVVSVVFIQRHFSDVTQAMTISMAREIRLLLDQLPTEGTEAEVRLHDLGAALEIRMAPLNTPPAPAESRRRWYDLTGLVVTHAFREALPGFQSIDLPNDTRVNLRVEAVTGLMELQFDRSRVSPSNAHQLFVNMLFFGGLMTLIAFIYLRNQLRPITRLAKAAEAFGRGRSVVYRPSGALEVRAAGNAFLDMRARIERHLQQRTLLLSGVSHDLRTPLTRLKLGLALLEDEDRAALERDVDDMQKMLDGFLSFSRGAGDGAPEEVAPDQLLRQIVEDCKRSNIPASLYRVDVPEGVTMPLRPLAIQRAVTNLIENAVRYGNHAEVSIKLSEKMLRIRVEDDGPGIPPEQRAEALKPFSRLDSARNQNLGSGVGLGLAIANDTARAHGGVLRLGESQRMGGLCADIVIGR